MRVRRSLLALLALVPLVQVGASPARAQMIPPHATLRDFEPLGDYNLEVGGANLTGVKMFRSEKAGSAVLMTGQGLAAAYVLVPRERVLQRVDTAKVVVGQDGSAYLLSDAVLARESAFAMDGRDVTFTIQGKPARLKEKPYLLGLHPGQDLLQHDPAYAFRAKKYQPSQPLVRSLRQAGEPVRVRIFFGNWCPHCQQMVPRVLRVAEALAGSPIRFEFYGLPVPFSDEPEAKRLGITGVPTGVVYRGNRELGRIAGNEFTIPELALKRILDSAGKPSR